MIRDRARALSFRWAGLLAVLVVFTTAASACSGSSNDNSPPEQSASTIVPTSTSTTTAPSTSTSTSTSTTQVEGFPPYSTANTPIGVLVDDPDAYEVLQAYLPPEFGNEATLELIRDTSLKGIQGYGANVLTDEVLARIDADLAELTPQSGDVVAGNYDETLVRSYELPAPLTLADGTVVEDADTWRDERRPEILEFFEESVYGRSPERPDGQWFEVVESQVAALDGRATRTKVVIHLGDQDNAPTVDLVRYIPADAGEPVPVLLMLGFQELGETDDVSALIDAGYGVAGINYIQLDPDNEDAYAGSVRSYFDGGGEADRAPNAWGAIAAWGWGLSRAQDYLETDPSVDADRVAIFGASRTGRAVLWAGARDDRFAAVIACCSGKLGASLLRRNYGDPIANLQSDYYVAPDFVEHSTELDSLPVDAHMLLSLIAPRSVLLQTGRFDHAADPKGEYLAAVAASPVFELLGADGLGASASEWPPAEPLLGDIGYYMHGGGHGPLPESWAVFIEFLDEHL